MVPQPLAWSWKAPMVLKWFLHLTKAAGDGWKHAPRIKVRVLKLFFNGAFPWQKGCDNQGLSFSEQLFPPIVAQNPKMTESTIALFPSLGSQRYFCISFHTFKSLLASSLLCHTSSEAWVGRTNGIRMIHINFFSEDHWLTMTKWTDLNLTHPHSAHLSWPGVT